jgi:hypothetical protein
MKTCNRCGYTAGRGFHSIKGKVLCEDCYGAWTDLLQHIFMQFLWAKLRIEEEPHYEKII